jgi:hypothetical protein
MRPHYYKLNERGDAIPCDPFEAAKLLASVHGRCVACETLPNGLTVSTAFLVFDHAPFGREPILWDTRVYDRDGSVRVAGRYSTLAKARRSHVEIVSLVRLLG